MTVSIMLHMPSNATIEDLLDAILVYNVTFVYDTGSLPEGTWNRIRYVIHASIEAACNVLMRD